MAMVAISLGSTLSFGAWIRQIGSPPSTPSMMIAALGKGWPARCTRRPRDLAAERHERELNLAQFRTGDDVDYGDDWPERRAAALDRAPHWGVIRADRRPGRRGHATLMVGGGDRGG